MVYGTVKSASVLPAAVTVSTVAGTIAGLRRSTRMFVGGLSWAARAGQKDCRGFRVGAG